MKVVLEKARRKDKKFRAVFSDGKVVEFGQRGMLDYTLHHDDKRKQLFLHRFHKLIQKYQHDPQAPMTLSTWILWNRPSLQESLKSYKQHFHLS